jgi:hypothetical protein
VAFQHHRHGHPYGFVDLGGLTTADPAPVSVTPASIKRHADSDPITPPG